MQRAPSDLDPPITINHRSKMPDHINRTNRRIGLVIGDIKRDFDIDFVDLVVGFVVVKVVFVVVKFVVRNVEGYFLGVWGGDGGILVG